MKIIYAFILLCSTSIYTAENSRPKKPDFWHPIFKDTMKQPGNQDLALVFFDRIPIQERTDDEYLMANICRGILTVRRNLIKSLSRAHSCNK